METIDMRFVRRIAKEYWRKYKADGPEEAGKYAARVIGRDLDLENRVRDIVKSLIASNGATK